MAGNRTRGRGSPESGGCDAIIGDAPLSTHHSRQDSAIYSDNQSALRVRDPMRIFRNPIGVSSLVPIGSAAGG